VEGYGQRQIKIVKLATLPCFDYMAISKLAGGSHSLHGAGGTFRLKSRKINKI
jgi:hypothetical protein